MNLAQRGDEPTPTFGACVLELVVSAYPELELSVVQKLEQGFFSNELVKEEAHANIWLRLFAFGPNGP